VQKILSRIPAKLVIAAKESIGFGNTIKPAAASPPAPDPDFSKGELGAIPECPPDPDRGYEAAHEFVRTYQRSHRHADSREQKKYDVWDMLAAFAAGAQWRSADLMKENADHSAGETPRPPEEPDRGKVVQETMQMVCNAPRQLTEGTVKKGGHNPPNTSAGRPPAPGGSGGREKGEKA
jgi:hypothetical protein